MVEIEVMQSRLNSGRVVHIRLECGLKNVP